MQVVVYMLLVLQMEMKVRSVSDLKKEHFLMYMELLDFLVLQIAPVVMVFDYNLVVVNSEIIDHVFVAFVVEYH
jgi:hypothetical protein